MKNNCKAMMSCNGMKNQNLKSAGMDQKRKDLIATPKFKKVMQEYGNGSLKTSSGQQVNSPKQAEAIAASESNQSYNQQTKKQKNADRYGMRGKNG